MKKLLMLTLVSILFVSTTFANESVGLPKGQCLKSQASQARMAGKNIKKDVRESQDSKTAKTKITQE